MFYKRILLVLVFVFAGCQSIPEAPSKYKRRGPVFVELKPDGTVVVSVMTPDIEFRRTTKNIPIEFVFMDIEVGVDVVDDEIVIYGEEIRLDKESDL